MTREAWVEKHPYLRRMCELQSVVDAAVTEVIVPTASIPTWSDYLCDFHAGVPLLLGTEARIDLRPVETALGLFLEKLASEPLPAKLNYQTTDLLADRKSDVSFAERVIDWLIKKTTFFPRHPGLLHYLGWTLIARYLRQVTLAFARWRDEERWLRNYCPMCGAFPAMAQLVGNDPVRLRLLSCGCCATRWRYLRTGCPFCDAADDSRLAVLAIEGEAALRIDYCDTCGAYLKTYEGEGCESILIADWTSLHLDVIAQDRGFRRYAASLYQL